MSILFPVGFWKGDGEIPPPEQVQMQVQLLQTGPASYKIGFALNPEQEPFALAQAQFAFVTEGGEVPPLAATIGIEGSPFADWEIAPDPEFGGVFCVGPLANIPEGESVDAFDLQYEADQVILTGLNPEFPTLFLNQEEQEVTYQLVILE